MNKDAKRKLTQDEINEIKEFESKTECLKFLGLSKTSGKNFFNGKMVKKVKNWALKLGLPNQNHIYII